MPKVGGKGRILHSQAREIVFNVFKYFDGIQPKLTKATVFEKVHEATKVAPRTVERIVAEAKRLGNNFVDPTFVSPKKVINRQKPVCNLDDFDLDALRRLINNYHIINKSHITVRKLMEEMNSAGIHFNGSSRSLRKILHKIGFAWKKIEDNRNILIERHDIRLLRIKYLRKITEYRQQNRNIIYTDETYIHSTHTKSMTWTDKKNKNAGIKIPISKGSRLIIVHAGYKEGFVPNAKLVFKSGLKTGDYHDDMNSVNYVKWLKEKLIPNLPPNSIVVMDNASYHNVLLEKQPTCNSRKSEMIQWLQVRRIHFPTTATNAELYEIIKMYKQEEKKFTVDTLLREHGHTVLRLPPYHPELNPIEKIWAQVKGKVAANNTAFKMEEVITLTDRAIQEIGKQNWESVCQHVVNEEIKYMKEEHMWDNIVEQFIIRVDDQEDTDYDDSCSETDIDIGVNELPPDSE